MSINRQDLGVIFGIIVFLMIMVDLVSVRNNYIPSIEIDQTIEKIAATKNITVNEKAYMDGKAPGAMDINDFFREVEKKDAKTIYYTLSQYDNSLEKTYWIATNSGEITDEYRQIYKAPISTIFPWPSNLRRFIFDNSFAVSIERYDSKTVEYGTRNPITSYGLYAVTGGFLAFLAGYLLWLVFFCLGIEKIGKSKVT